MYICIVYIYIYIYVVTLYDMVLLVVLYCCILCYALLLGRALAELLELGLTRGILHYVTLHYIIVQDSIIYMVVNNVA